MTQLYFWFGLGMCAMGIYLLVYWAARVRPLPAPTLGIAGLNRHDALRQPDSNFRFVEPIIRYVAAHLDMWLSDETLVKIDSKLEPQLSHAGYMLGLTPLEFVAARVLSALTLCGITLLGRLVSDYSMIYVVMATVLGAYLPKIQLLEETKKRFKLIDRELPNAIDLCSMCMGAGMDFVGSLKQFLSHAPGTKSPIQEELRRVLQDLELGHTRKQALLLLLERAPTPTIKDFVSSVIQAEEKGTPLAQVLRIQATMLRMRRSVSAEEAAAKAAVKMMVPLMMIFGSIMLMILGPLFIQVMHQGI